MRNSQWYNRQAVNDSTSTRKCIRWTPAEDCALVTAIGDLLDLGGWKGDNGQFKSGAWAKVEAIMIQKLPGCDKKAKPHIESRVKTLRKQYDAIAEMLSPSASGFGWNDEGNFVTCRQSVWDDWVKSHQNATGLRNKPFPLYEELNRIFGNDRASGNESANTQDALDELKKEDRHVEEQISNVNVEELTTPNTQSREETPTLATPSGSRTKKARIETIEALKEFSNKLEKISDVMETAGEHIGRLASCFQHESESAVRRMQVTSEVMKISGLTLAQVLLA